MMRKRTVIVVGAGASAEVGLPIGRDLRGQIAGLLDIHFREDGTQQRGDRCIAEAIRFHIQQNDLPRATVNAYFRASRGLRDALPLAMSIDNLLDAHADDVPTQICGKLGICRAILAAERRSTLFTDTRADPKRSLDFQKVDSTWFSAFFRLLTQECRIADLPSRLESLCLVVFNYDRCIEHFLWNAIQHYYRVDHAVASSVLSNVKILHPYGSVGGLPWQRGTHSVEFGAEPATQEFLEIFDGIRTFTESTNPDSDDTKSIRRHLTEAQLVLFLGFAYHSLNLKLLTPDPRGEWGPTADCYGTAFGLSTPDTNLLTQELATLSGLPLDRITLRNDLKCADLFNEYWRTLELR